MTKTRLSPEKTKPTPKIARRTKSSNKTDKKVQKQSISSTVNAPTGSAKKSESAKSRRVNIGDFTILKTLGKGTSATVKLVEQASTKRRMALKLLMKDQGKESSDQ